MEIILDFSHELQIFEPDIKFLYVSVFNSFRRFDFFYQEILDTNHNYTIMHQNYAHQNQIIADQIKIISNFSCCFHFWNCKFDGCGYPLWSTIYVKLVNQMDRLYCINICICIYIAIGTWNGINIATKAF